MSRFRTLNAALLVALACTTVQGFSVASAQAPEAPVPGLAQGMRPASPSPATGSGVRVQSSVTELDASRVQVQLQFEGVRAQGGASVAYTLSGSGQIVEQDATRLPAAQASSRQVTVRLGPGGAHYLNVFTRQQGRSGVTSIALDKSPLRRKAAPASPASPDAAGRNLVVLPGQLRH